MAMALVAPAFAIPTGTTGAVTAPPETRSATLVTAALGTPVGLYGIQDTDSNVGVQQGDGGESTTPQDSLGADQEDSAEASQEENGAEAGQEVDTDTEVQQDTVVWSEKLQSSMSEFQRSVIDHREDRLHRARGRGCHRGSWLLERNLKNALQHGVKETTNWPTVAPPCRVDRSAGPSLTCAISRKGSLRFELLRRRGLGRSRARA